MIETDDTINIISTTEFDRHIPRDLESQNPKQAKSQPSKQQATMSSSARHHDDEDNVANLSKEKIQMCPTAAKVGKDTIMLNMEIKFPKKAKQKKIVEKKSQGSMLSGIFSEQKFPEPVYFQNVDCVALPNFFTPRECRQIIDFAESQGFSTQHRHRVLNLSWTDLVDPYFGEAVWSLCGLGWFLRTITVDGMVPCGLNDVIRIQKYTQGNLFGRHIDQNVHRADSKISKYSLRVFLNGSEEEFEGGLSVFHVPFREDPVVFEPETGLALLYPQGNMCTVQEEAEVLYGCKYVLRADILFCPKDQLDAAVHR